MADVHVEQPTEVRGGEASVGELLSRVTDDFSSLVRSHVELAKVEIKEEVTKAGKGAGFLSGAAVCGLIAVNALSFALAWWIGGVLTDTPAWGFLVVGLLWAAGAAVLALTGKKELQAVKPVPEQTKEAIQDDVQWAKEQRA